MKKKTLLYIGSALCLIGLVIVGFVDLRISLGLFIFGTGMNLENKNKK